MGGEKKPFLFGLLHVILTEYFTEYSVQQVFL